CPARLGRSLGPSATRSSWACLALNGGEGHESCSCRLSGITPSASPGHGPGGRFLVAVWVVPRMGDDQALAQTRRRPVAVLAYQAARGVSPPIDVGHHP